VFDVATQREISVRQASEACCWQFIERGSTDVTVSELAAAAGVAERTFYRYFPTKELTIVPILAYEARHFSEVLAATEPSRSLSDALVGAFAAASWGPLEDRTRALVPLIMRDPVMRAVWLQAINDSESEVRPVIASRLGVEPESAKARAATTCAVALSSMALTLMAETGRDPISIYAEALAAVDDGLFATSITRIRTTN
jgi:AcrR family transcriptional regulator